MEWCEQTIRLSQGLISRPDVNGFNYSNLVKSMLITKNTASCYVIVQVKYVTGVQYPLTFVFLSSAKWDNYENKVSQIHSWLSVNLFSFWGICLSKDQSGGLLWS